MVIAAVIRISGFASLGRQSLALVWSYFWFHLEACIAVIAVSFTTFRSLFVNHTVNQNNRRLRRWHSSREKLWTRKKHSAEGEGLDNLPSMPSATLPSSRTFIHGGRRIASLRSIGNDDQCDDWSLPRHGQHITVTHHVSIENVR